MLDINKLRRRINRLENMAQPFEEQEDRGTYYTYHGGYSHGWLKGQLNILYEILEDWEDANE